MYPDMIAHMYNPSAKKAERLEACHDCKITLEHTETLSQKKMKSKTQNWQGEGARNLSTLVVESERFRVQGHLQ